MREVIEQASTVLRRRLRRPSVSQGSHRRFLG